MLEPTSRIEFSGKTSDAFLEDVSYLPYDVRSHVRQFRDDVPILTEYLSGSYFWFPLSFVVHATLTVTEKNKTILVSTELIFLHGIPEGLLFHMMS